MFFYFYEFIKWSKESFFIEIAIAIITIIVFVIRIHNIKNFFSRYFVESKFYRFNKNELNNSLLHYRANYKYNDFIVKSRTYDLLYHLIDIYEFTNTINVKLKSVFINLTCFEDYSRIHISLIRFFNYYQDKNGIKFIFIFNKNENEKEFIQDIKEYLKKHDLKCIKVI